MVGRKTLFVFWSISGYCGSVILKAHVVLLSAFDADFILISFLCERLSSRCINASRTLALADVNRQKLTQIV